MNSDFFLTVKMRRSVLPCPTLPNEISVREHDYSIRLIKIAGFPKKKNKSAINAPSHSNVNGKDQYEITELFIEVRMLSDLFLSMSVYIRIPLKSLQPIVTNIVKVSDVSFCTNIPLEDICRSDDMVEITPIGNQFLCSNILL